MDNFDKDQIKKAINKFQDEHPQMVWHDVTQIKNEECIDILSSQIEIIARKLQEDTDMYIVCEMAKKYLEGARPVYPVRPQGEWVVDDWNKIIECNKCGGQAPIDITSGEQYESNFCPCCGAEMKRSDEE